MFAVMGTAGDDSWIRQKAADSLEPRQVETSLRPIAENWPDTGPALFEVIDKFPLGQAPLLHLLAISSICASRLQRSPETLLWVSQPEVSLARRGAAQMLSDLRLFAGD